MLMPRADAGRDDFELVLLHELHTCRRARLPHAMVAQISCALHWFNPLRGSLGGRAHERERACDDWCLPRPRPDRTMRIS